MSDRRRVLEVIHQRIGAGDPIASKDLFEVIHRPLWRVLTGAYGAQGLSEEQAIDSATDAIAEYIRDPNKYDPRRASLFTYLSVIAKGDALNRLRKAGSYVRTLKRFVELERADGNVGMEDDTATRIDAETIIRKYGKNVVESQTDIVVLRLILVGEGDTEVYATAIGVSALPSKERRAAVKKYRDKIEKRLRRLAESL